VRRRDSERFRDAAGYGSAPRTCCGPGVGCPASPLACPGERTDACPRRRSGTGVARRPSRTIRVTLRRPVLHEERQAPERRLPRSRGESPQPAGDPADGTSGTASRRVAAAQSTSASRGRPGTTSLATAAWCRPAGHLRRCGRALIPVIPCSIVAPQLRHGKLRGGVQRLEIVLEVGGRHEPLVSAARRATRPKTGTSPHRLASHLEDQARAPLGGTPEGSADRANEHKAPPPHPEESSASRGLADC
jgi:hypothetical protein